MPVEELNPGPSSAPFGEGDELSVTIDDVAFGGEGVGRYEDFVVFVPFVAVGETVSVRIREVKRNYAKADLINVLSAAPDRVDPLCPHFTRCGGCQYQHLSYETQLTLKHRQITEHFRRIGAFENATIDPIVACPKPFYYRNRILVRGQWHKPLGKRVVGFLQPNSRLVEPIDECRIAEPELNERLQDVTANPPPRNGMKVNLRKMPKDWRLPPDSFFQVNFHMLPSLVETIGSKIGASGSRFLIDAYCGVGFFALSLADRVERYVGVEIDQSAIKAARKNAEDRGATNGEFIAAPTEEILDDLLTRFPREETVALLDPPRKGCAGPGLDALRKARPRQLIYVSCHPATLARDLKILCADDLYQLESVTPLDMFPQTQHVECVANLLLNDSGIVDNSRLRPRRHFD